MTTPTIGSLTYVRWIDAEDKKGGWHSQEEVEEFAEEAMVVESVGWLVSATKLFLTLAADISGPDTRSRVTKIPMGMIQLAEAVSLPLNVTQDGPLSTE